MSPAQSDNDPVSAAEDAGWVADLVTTYREGDLTAVETALRQVLEAVHRARRARRVLAKLPPDRLLAGLVVAAGADRAGAHVGESEDNR